MLGSRVEARTEVGEGVERLSVCPAPRADAGAQTCGQPPRRPSSPTHPPPAVRVEARPGKGRAKHSALWELLAGVMEPSREKKTEGRAVPRPIVGARA